MIGSVCTVDRAVRADELPLTDNRPNQEHWWDVPVLNDGQGDMVPEVEGSHE